MISYYYFVSFCRVRFKTFLKLRAHSVTELWKKTNVGFTDHVRFLPYPSPNPYPTSYPILWFTDRDFVHSLKTPTSLPHHLMAKPHFGPIA